MKHKRNKFLSAFLCLSMIAALASCSKDGSGSSSSETGSVSNESSETSSVQASETSSEDNNSDTFMFTDSTGREVELPKDIKKVASGGPLANIMIYAVKPEVIVGWSSAPSESAKKYVDEKYWNLPEYGKFYDNTGDFNREALMASEPDVIIDIGAWDEEYKVNLDTLQEQVGIPVILVEANLEQNPAAYRTLGELFGEEERGESLASYCEEVLNDAKEKADSIPEDQRKTVFYAEGETGLSTIISGTIHSQIYELIGAEIVVETDSVQTQKGGGTVSMEQLMAWDPDVIMFAKGSIYSDVETDTSWNALTAVQNGEFYEIPTDPYNWLGRPPGPNRMVGVRWLGNLLYPEVFDYDIEQEVKDFYSLFYRYDLSDQEVSELLENSTLKTSTSSASK